jgi:aldehyde dehydrogenase (NAD+)
MGKADAEEFEAKLLIEGELRQANGGKTFSVINPANQTTVGKAALGMEEDARAAVDSAARAFGPWSSIPAPERAEALFRLGELIRAHREGLARQLTLEEGKPLREALGEVDQAYNTAMYYAGEGRRMWSLVTPSENREKLTLTIRKPLGVVAVITPWNFPAMIPMWNIAPALVMGNTVVFKPASYTPLVAARFAELLMKAGVPPGVFNLVTGPGSRIGDALVNHPDVAAVAFTGETQTGRHISEANARFMRRQILELGGKNPLIVASDAEMEVALGGALWSAFSNAGQKCTAASRIIVVEPILDAFSARFTEAASKLRVGDGLERGTEVGPLVSEPGLQKVRKYVNIGLDEGAKLLAGGRDFEDPELTRGHF